MAIKIRNTRARLKYLRLTKPQAAAFALIRGGKPRQAWPGRYMNMTVDIDLSRFVMFPSLAIAGMNDGLLEAVEAITEKARKDAPKETGALKASGRYIELPNTSNALTYEIRFGDDLPDARAVFQEFGTKRHDPKPYLYPAVRQIKIAGIVSKAIKKKIKEGK